MNKGMWYILGIEPTTNIKEIKRAYAKLAKQYNPEEHPDEFRRIYEAYKTACAYAKNSHLHNIITLDISSHKSQDDITDNNDINEEKSSEYDFSDVEIEKPKVTLKSKEIPFEFDFLDIKVYKKSDSDYIPDDVTPKAPEFDFSGVELDLDLTYDDTYWFSSNIHSIIANMEYLLSDENEYIRYTAWQRFFIENDIEPIKTEIEFRKAVSDLLKNKLFPKQTAILLQQKLGYNTIIYPDKYNSKRYHVNIKSELSKNDLHNPNSHIKRKQKTVWDNIKSACFIITIIGILGAAINVGYSVDNKPKTPVMSAPIVSIDTSMNDAINAMISEAIERNRNASNDYGIYGCIEFEDFDIYFDDDSFTMTTDDEDIFGKYNAIYNEEKNIYTIMLWAEGTMVHKAVIRVSSTENFRVAVFIGADLEKCVGVYKD